jgi:endonuclease-3
MKRLAKPPQRRQVNDPEVPGALRRQSKPFSRREAALFFKRLKRRNADPKTELVYANPFTLLVAVVLSAQATDKGVNSATDRLFKRAQTPQQMLQLGEDSLISYIKSIGLYRTKARNILALSRALIDRHDGNVPDSREALESLPGVGRKTANVVLNEAFGEPTIAVDTHVFRVANRTGLAPGNTPLAVESNLLSVVPQAYLHGAHHWLILHGRYVCVARQPKCPDCVVHDLCRYPMKTEAHPRPSLRAAKRQRL